MNLQSIRESPEMELSSADESMWSVRYTEDHGDSSKTPCFPLGSLGIPPQNDDDDDDDSVGERTLVEEGVRHVLAHWKVILLGQVLSFFMASAGAAQAGLHLRCQVSVPFFSIAITFSIQSLCFIPLYRQQRREPWDERPQLFRIPLRAPVPVYILIALMEVQSLYWTVSAFRYTTLTSVALLDAVSLPSAMLLSRIWLKRRYMRLHLVGAVVCLAGVVINMLGDYTLTTTSESNNPYPQKIIGDIYAFSGAIMMGVNHVFSEVLIKDLAGPTEYLGAVGIFAFPVALIMSLLVERSVIASLFQGNDCSAGVGSLLWTCSILASSLALSGTAGFLLVSEAALLNLSLLTTDLWSATFSVLAENIVPPPMFWVALVVIFLGVFIYEIGPSPAAHGSTREAAAKEESMRSVIELL